MEGQRSGGIVVRVLRARKLWVGAVLAALVAGGVGIAFGLPARGATPAPHATPAPSATATTPSAPEPRSGTAGSFDRAFQDGIDAAAAYAKSRPDVLGIAVHDRVTGAAWSNEGADTPVWAASTIKLAMTVDLLTRDRAGQIHLTDADRDLIHRMLHVSDNDATSTLWDRYGGADFATRFPSHGLTSATFVPGYPQRWGYMKVTAHDLERLMDHVLTAMPADQRDWIVAEMRSVDANQQWGVWGAGPAQKPGNKNGWTTWQGIWVLNSVGFAGPGERYTVVMTSELRDGGSYDEGVRAENTIARLLFADLPPATR